MQIKVNKFLDVGASTVLAFVLGKGVSEIISHSDVLSNVTDTPSALTAVAGLGVAIGAVAWSAIKLTNFGISKLDKNEDGVPVLELPLKKPKFLR